MSQSAPQVLGPYWIVERRVGDRWLPLGLPEMQSCTRSASASRMVEVDALRNYRSRAEIDDRWAALSMDHARTIDELWRRSATSGETQLVEVTVTRTTVS